MNQEKATEFFSAYYEGELEPALQFALEQRLKSDPKLRADYEAFTSTFTQLQALREEDIELPIYLSDRIATRLDEVEKSRKRSWFDLKFLGRSWSSGLAAYALVGAVVSIGAYSAVSRGGLGAESASTAPTFVATANKVTLQFDAPGTHAILVQSGETRKRMVVAHPDKLNAPLNNDTPTAKLFSIQLEGSADREVVSVPGAVRSGLDRARSASGDGTVGDFAKAFADYYQTPVLLENIPIGGHVKWSFDNTDSVKAATDALNSLHFSVGVRSDGMISVLLH